MSAGDRLPSLRVPTAVAAIALPVMREHLSHAPVRPAVQLRGY